MDKREPPQKAKSPTESQYADFEPASPAIDPSDGGIAPGWAGTVGVAGPVMPPADEMPCARGPCRHYWAMTHKVDYGNPRDTFEELGIPEPRQHVRTCTCGPVETDITNEFIHDCSRWDPLTERELDELEGRREAVRRREQVQAEDLFDTAESEGEGSDAVPLASLAWLAVLVVAFLVGAVAIAIAI